MVDEDSARRVAERFICKEQGRLLTANQVVFMSAARKRERILALVRKPEEESIAQQLIKEARDYWAVGFDTLLVDGSRFVEETTIRVDAETGCASFE